MQFIVIKYLCVRILNLLIKIEIDVSIGKCYIYGSLQRDLFFHINLFMIFIPVNVVKINIRA